MGAIRRMLWRVRARIRAGKEPVRTQEPEGYDRHWGEWWIFLEAFRGGRKEN